MEILAVVIGYLLGVAPFVIPKIVELIQNRTKKQEEKEENKEQKEIIDEWLNGPNPKEEQSSVKDFIDNNISQEDIYKEYVTGIPSTKGE